MRLSEREELAAVWSLVAMSNGDARVSGGLALFYL